SALPSPGRNGSPGRPVPATRTMSALCGPRNRLFRTWISLPLAARSWSAKPNHPLSKTVLFATTTPPVSGKRRRQPLPHCSRPRLGEEGGQVDPGLQGSPDAVPDHVDVVHQPPEVDPRLGRVEDQVVPDDDAARRQGGSAVVGGAVDVHAELGPPEGAVPDDR